MYRMAHKERCKNGTRRNKKTGNCEPYPPAVPAVAVPVHVAPAVHVPTAPIRTAVAPAAQAADTKRCKKGVFN